LLTCRAPLHRSLYNTAIIVRLVLTWFPSPPAQLVGPLASVTDPYLNLFRGIIPPLGGTIDLSPILAFLCLDVRCPDRFNDSVHAALSLGPYPDVHANPYPARSTPNPTPEHASSWPVVGFFILPSGLNNGL